MQSQARQFNKNDLIRWLFTVLEVFGSAAIVTSLNMMDNQQPIDWKVVAVAGVMAVLNFIRRWAFNNGYSLVPTKSLDK